MHRFTAKAVLSLAVSANLSILPAATPYIGVATSDGNLTINNAKTAGNATIFDGSTIQTEKATSQIRLKDGGRVLFSPDSRGQLYSDRLVLEKGSARIANYAADASGLKITPDADASAAISLRGSVVEVAAINGGVRVYNANGINVANLAAGRALSLRPQEAGGSVPSSLVGCVTKSGDTYLLTDETSNVTVELRGGNVKEGQRVQISGSQVPNATPAGGATQVVNVMGVKVVGGSCPATTPGGVAAAGAGAGAAAAGAAAAGVSTGTAVVAGIAAAAVVGGTVAAIAATSGPSGQSTTSTGQISPSR
jgi:hypothetical protein